MNFPLVPVYEEHDKNKTPKPSAGFDTNNYGFSSANDIENGELQASGFTDDRVRNRFVKKVMGILGVQLMITFGFF